MDIERIRKASGLIREGMYIFASGPLDYYLENLVASYELMRSRFAPFKLGARVELAKTPDITPAESPGWMTAWSLNLNPYRSRNDVTHG